MKNNDRAPTHLLRRYVCAQVLGIYLAVSGAPAVAAPTTPPASLAQTPQFLPQQPAPSVFVTVDNSGSMLSEFLPDSPGFPVSERLFPIPLETPYDPADGRPTNNVGNFQGFAHAINVARARSSADNVMYYNPRLRYQPWAGVDVNGVAFGNANPSNALFHPFFPARGGLDLVAGKIANVNGNAVNSGEGNFANGYTAPSVSGTPTFAVYYVFDASRPNCDGTRGDLDCFQRVEIVPSQATYFIPDPSQRGGTEPGCTAVAGGMSCSYAAELQNFANWFQYYRSRTLLARGAMGLAMAALGENFRAGVGTINNPTVTVDGFSSNTVLLGVRPFSGQHRADFFNRLNNHEVGGTTPTGRAMAQVGQYFAWKADGSTSADPGSTSPPHPNGPWADNPGAAGTGFAACRQGYHVVSTDGYWNENRDTLFNSTIPSSFRADIENADNSTGPWIAPPGVTCPGGANCYRYDPTAATGAFTNGLGNTNNRRYRGPEARTLADIGMYFWSRDLQPAMPNLVAPSTANPAYWQNLSTLAVALGLTGTRTAQGGTFLQNLDAGTDTWPTVSTLDPTAADDLWHAAVNSRGRLLVANDPQELSSSLAKALQEIIARSASGSGAAATTAFLDTGNGIFTAEFTQGTWVGDLYRREVDPLTLQFREFSGNPWVWRASDLIAAPDARPIYTMRTSGARVNFVAENGVDGVDSTQMADLASPLAPAADIIAYVRGDRSRELSATPVAGNLRDRPRADPSVPGSRNNVLGSIVNSSPLYVKDDDFAYDRLAPGTPGQSTYQAYVRANTGTSTTPGRTPTIWVGSNGGMFHGFNAETGAEIFAYVPRSIIRNLPLLADPQYQHRYFVDGVPASGDAYIAPGGSGTPSWRTVVVSSLGAGGRSVFAIDVTDPAAIGGGSILWDADEYSLSPSDYSRLGHVPGPAFVARARNGKWVAVFGNGYESDTKTAALFVLDLETGAVIRVLDTGAGGTGDPNGLSAPQPIFNNDRELIGAYAGDLHGNLWKFDLSDSNSGAWNVAFGGQPLFVARNGNGERQPIFMRPIARRHPNGGGLVIFGTGKLFSPGDKENAQVQTLYGVWDKPGAGGLNELFRSGTEMVQQAITLKDEFDPNTPNDQPTNYRLTNFPVDYGSGRRGWYLDLGVQYTAGANGVSSPVIVTPRERMVTTPIFLGQNLLAQSFIPSVAECEPGGQSFLYRLDPMTGSFFGVGSFVDAGSGAMQTAGGFGLLGFFSPAARGVGQDPGGGGSGGGPAPGRCPEGTVMQLDINGNPTGTCVPLGGLGAVRTWRQILD